MGREKRKVKKKPALRTAPGDQAKERHLRDRNGVLHDWSAPMPKGLVAKPAVLQTKSKHHTYYEFVENKEKKKKLEFQITTNKTPPPGYEFVPIGNPELTTACKELSREKDAMVFIVSNVTSDIAPELSLALNREGHHIREKIVEEARASLGELDADEDELDKTRRQNGETEPIPKSQEEINKQADAAIRDHFPRIPNTDRQRIIERSFRKGAKMGGKPLVGLNPELSLSRRVQLAVIAHIRHEYTRYDRLLRETTYANARKAVAPLCLDYLVKWRGDEETGRDQLDEILREVVVISDSEDDDSEDDDDDVDDEITDLTSADVSGDDLVESPAESPASPAAGGPLAVRQGPAPTYSEKRRTAGEMDANGRDGTGRKMTRAQRRALKRSATNGVNKEHRGFQRYQAVRDQAWQQAVERQRGGQDQDTPRPPPVPVAVSRPTSYAPQTLQERPQEQGFYYPAQDHRDTAPYPNNHHAAQTAQTDGNYSNRIPHNVLASPGYHGMPSGGPGAPPEARQYYKEAPVREARGINGLEPIVGRGHPDYGFETVVRRPAEDLRDYLVPSIEPVSPVAPQIHLQDSANYCQPYYQQGPWQSRPGRQPADVLPRNTAAYPSADEPILVRRLPAGPRDPVVRPLDPYYHVPSSSSSRAPYMAEEGMMIRREEPRPLARDEFVRYDPAPRTAARFATSMDNRVGNRDESDLRGPSHPIVIDDDLPRAGRIPPNSRPPVDYLGQDPEVIVIRRAVDPYPAAPVDRAMPLDFIPVSNRFPRPHEPRARRDEAWPPPETSRRGPGIDSQHRNPPHRQEYYGVPTEHVPETRTYLPRQERVMRLECVNYEYPNEDQGQRLYEREQPSQCQYPVSARPGPDVVYRAPPPQRHPRQDSVIYIE